MGQTPVELSSPGKSGVNSALAKTPRRLLEDFRVDGETESFERGCPGPADRVDSRSKVRQRDQSIFLIWGLQPSQKRLEPCHRP